MANYWVLVKRTAVELRLVEAPNEDEVADLVRLGCGVVDASAATSLEIVGVIEVDPDLE